MKKILLVAVGIGFLGLLAWAMPAQAQTNPHYCCWQAKGIKDKFNITFTDQVASGIGEKCKFKAVCNPCDKNLSGTPPNLSLHYCLWQCKGPKISALYTVTDQFVTNAQIETKKLKYILNQCTKL